MKHTFTFLSVVFMTMTAGSSAQTTLDALQSDLNTLKQQRQQTNDQSLSYFLSQVNVAAQNKEAAKQLFLISTGQAPSTDPNNPAPAPSTLDYTANEAADPSTRRKEKHHHGGTDDPYYPNLDEREAQQQAKETDAATFSNMIQTHCALLHFAALFSCKSDKPGLQQEFVKWLSMVGPTYPQLGHSLLGRVKMQESPISSYLNFNLWNNSEQSQWSVHSLPELYRTQIVQSLATNHNAQVLSAWDVYIAMRQSDSRDEVRWTNEVYPELLFDRACDDYSLSPDMTKLSALVAILKTVPGHPQFNDMMSRVNQFLSDYRASHSNPGQNTATVPADSSSPVPVSTPTSP